MTPEELIIEELRLLCEHMDVDSIEISSSKIYKFADLFLHDSLLIPISNELYKAQNDITAPLNAILKKLSQKTSNLCKKTEEYVKKNHITDQDIINDLPWLKQQKELDVTVFFIQLFALGRIFKALLHSASTDHHEFIKQYATIDESNDLLPITFPINTDQLAAECQYLNRIEQTCEWHYLRQIINFYIVYNPKVYAEQKDNANKQHPINKQRLDICYNALNRAIGPTKDPYHPEEGFNPRTFKMYMQQLYLYVQKKLTKPISLAATVNLSDWSYTPQTRKFTYQGKRAKFRIFKIRDEEPSDTKKAFRSVYGYPGKILEILTANDKNKKKSWRPKILNEEIIGTNPDNNYHQAIYDACAQINKQLLKDCDLKDFLECDTNSVRINPKYLN
ncbi:MAG: hypothetical protein P4L31_03750 [Candidatus Babeliales bacterium]|nr:hypothetical protein [Candidatus Babeliales bacterium]